jgi:pimeloyl-ACP methyl ester carboxylesterase
MAATTNKSTDDENNKKQIAIEFPFQSNFVQVHDSKIHYIDEGKGEPMLFLHGNPTSSYLWRNIIPHLTDKARCIAPDLIGMGKSDKPDIEYRFFDHARYVEGFIEKMKLKDITLVVHDWGSGLGFHYAMRNEDKISGIAFMESILFPLESWDMFPAADEELLNNAFKARIQATLDCVGIYAKLCHENRTSPVVPFMSLVKSTTSPNC